MTGYEITCIQSFIDHGHDVEVFSYSDCGAPSHFKVVDASRVLSKNSVFRYRSGPERGSIAGFSNRFRYTLLATADVWWIDTDVVCLSADWPDPIAPVCAGWEDEEKVGNAVLWTAPAFAEKLDQHAAGLGKGILWGQSGPDLLTEMLRSADLLAGMLPTNVFYPIHYDEWAKVFQPEFAAYVRDATQASCALHLWNEMLRRAQVDKTLAPNAESFFGSVVQRHQTGRYFETSRRTNPANGRSRGWRDIFSFRS